MGAGPASGEPQSGGHAPRGSGVDPDSRARTHLANERTFLAWLRTGLGLIVLGLAAAQFLERDQDLFSGVPAVETFAIFLALGGTATVVIGAVHYTQSRDRIEAERFRPAAKSVTVVAALVAAGGVMAMILVLFLGRS